jgi:death-on-curing protein
LAESLIRRHPFADGNKRTAIMAMAFWLEREGFRLEADPGELRDVARDVAAGKMRLEELASWLGDHAAGL